MAQSDAADDDERAEVLRRLLAEQSHTDAQTLLLRQCTQPLDSDNA